jgi:membrane protein DedA with SNARE-associated domain
MKMPSFIGIFEMIDWFNSLMATAVNAVTQNSFEAMAALFLVATLTEVGVPFPFVIDGALFITSFEGGLFSFQVLFVMLALVLGREVGAAIIFWLSRFVGDTFIKWLARHFPKLKIQEKMVRLHIRLKRQAPLAVAIGRLTPGLLTASSVAAGYCGMKYYQFVMGIILASAIADGALVIIGFATRHGLNILGFTPSTWEVVGVLVGVIFLVSLIRWLWSRRHPQKIISFKP